MATMSRSPMAKKVGDLGTAIILVRPERGGAMCGLNHGNCAMCGEGTPAFLSIRGLARLGSWPYECVRVVHYNGKKGSLWPS